MSYDELKQLCKKSWEKEYKYLCIDTSEKKAQRRNCICNESKNTYTECTPETNHSRFSNRLNVILNYKLT